MAWNNTHSGSSKEPLLNNEPPALGVPVPPHEPADGMIWSGTTWQSCPFCCMCCSPLCCSVWRWTISSQRIDLTHGCCGNDMETIDLRRVVELHFHRTLGQMCLNRGTIVICSDNAEFPELRLTTFGTKRIFERLRGAWTQARIATAVGEHDHHHGV